MRKLLAVLLVLVFVLALALPASAHNAGPCNDSEEPGHSDYAQHHIVAVAHEQGLGAGGHVPGSHQGYSACNPSGR